MYEEPTVPTETGDRVPVESTPLEMESSDPALVPEIVDSSQGLLPYFQEAMEQANAATDPTASTEYNSFLDLMPQETVAETVAPVTVEIIEDLRYDIVFSNLCSSFLICGTLVGCILMRKVYGT